MDGIIKNRDKLHLNFKMLSAMGLEKNVMYDLGCPTKVTDPYYRALDPIRHRNGTLWIQNRYNGILVDRVIRLYDSMFGDIAADKPMSVNQLHALATSYLTIYPKDNMSATRLYHLVKIIKSGASVRSTVINIEEDGCTSCGKRYHVHPKMTRKCSACELTLEAKSDPSIYNEIRKAIFVEESNLKNVDPKQLKLSKALIDVIRHNRETALATATKKQA